MRIPILLQAPPFDIKKVQRDIDSTRAALDNYLNHCQPRDTRSKHGLMGPAGKILAEVRSGRRDPESLKGYTLRVHEANQQYLDPGGIAALEEGINKLVSLLDQVPPTHVDTVVDRLDYGLYFSRRKKLVEQREALCSEFRTFLQRHYEGLPELSAAWDGPVPDWDRVYVFGPNSKTYKKANEQKKHDMANFWEDLRAQAKAPAQIVLEEEE